MDKKIKIGIIGCGGIAHSHARSYKQLLDDYKNMEIVALADIVPGRAEKFKEEKLCYNLLKLHFTLLW